MIIIDTTANTALVSIAFMLDFVCIFRGKLLMAAWLIRIGNHGRLLLLILLGYGRERGDIRYFATFGVFGSGSAASLTAGHGYGGLI